MNHSEKLYTNGRYLEQNPAWDREDSPWKADQVEGILRLNRIEPGSICEVGCGAGGVLAALRLRYPDNEMAGYDISPHAAHFWQHHAGLNIDFQVGDFLADVDCFDTILLLDVLEHLADPHTFLSRIKTRAKHFVIHFPLDLSASSVLRESPLLVARRKVGHIHYFTRGLALELLDESGFAVVENHYTGAAFNTPQAGFKTRLAELPRRIAYALNKELGVRLLGGETLMVLAKPK
jgi:hypothetical protein